MNGNVLKTFFFSVSWDHVCTFSAMHQPHQMHHKKYISDKKWPIFDSGC